MMIDDVAPALVSAGQVYEQPVINLDVAATAVALAGLPRDEKLDGVNLLPFSRGEQAGNPQEALFWRWRSQAAVRADHWKLILLGRDERYLFDLDSPEGEAKNRLAEHREIAAMPVGIAAGKRNAQGVVRQSQARLNVPPLDCHERIPNACLDHRDRFPERCNPINSGLLVASKNLIIVTAFLSVATAFLSVANLHP